MWNDWNNTNNVCFIHSELDGVLLFNLIGNQSCPIKEGTQGACCPICLNIGMGEGRREGGCGVLLLDMKVFSM